MTLDEAIARVASIAAAASPDALFAAAAAEHVRVPVPTKRWSRAGPLRELYPTPEAFHAALVTREEAALSAALQAMPELDGEALAEAALELVRHGKGELRRAAFFALAGSTRDEALEALLPALAGASSVPLAPLRRSRHPRAAARVRAMLLATGVDAPASPAKSRGGVAAGAAIGVLGALGEPEDIERLLRWLREHPDPDIRLACLNGLGLSHDPRAGEAVDACLADPDERLASRAVRVSFERDVPSAYDRFGRYVALATDRDALVVSTLLHAVHGGAVPRRVPASRDALLLEPRFVQLAARLRRDRRVGRSARMVLDVAPLAEAVRAIEANPIAPAPRPEAPPPARRDFLARYQAGDTSAWDEIARAAEAVAAHPDLALEAAAVAAALMRRVRENTDAVRETLRSAGARLAAERAPATADEIAAMERVTGPLPIALAALFREAGTLSLVPGGESRYDYGPCDLEDEGLSLLALDPLEIELDFAASEIQEHVERVRASHPEIVGPLMLALAPDYLHKQNISGGPAYSVELPPPSARDAVDPALLYERHGETLVGYLRLAFRWGGFPGLDVASLGPKRTHVNLHVPFEDVDGDWQGPAERLLAKLRRDLRPF